jgi:hypothetical protein
MPKSRVRPWPPDSSQIASGKPGAVHYRAWLLLNRAFAEANPQREPEPPPSWYPFQLGFVLAHVPTLASRLREFEADFDAAFDEDLAMLAAGRAGAEVARLFRVHRATISRIAAEARAASAEAQSLP